MNWTQTILAYAVSWWMIFFMALPFGVQRAEHPVAGASAGAPQKAYLAVKVVIVTALAALATEGIDLFLRSGIVTVK